MKKIVDTCSKNSDGNFVKDAVKLRLRGKGSGYKEGPLNKGNYNYSRLKFLKIKFKKIKYFY